MRFKVFAGNRVAVIRRKTKPEQWRHVASSENAADVLSRGCGSEAIPDS